MWNTSKKMFRTLVNDRFTQSKKLKPTSLKRKSRKELTIIKKQIPHF